MTVAHELLGQLCLERVSGEVVDHRMREGNTWSLLAGGCVVVRTGPRSRIARHHGLVE